MAPSPTLESVWKYYLGWLGSVGLGNFLVDHLGLDGQGLGIKGRLSTGSEKLFLKILA